MYVINLNFLHFFLFGAIMLLKCYFDVCFIIIFSCSSLVYLRMLYFLYNLLSTASVVACPAADPEGLSSSPRLGQVQLWNISVKKFSIILISGNQSHL